MLRRALDALNVSKRKRLGNSSLTTGLLSHEPREVELSGYYLRAPLGPGMETPSAIVDDDREILNVDPIVDLDLFLERFYYYFREKGLWCIIIKWVFELLSVAFTICFSGFFLLYVNWDGLRNAKCGMNALESELESCDLPKEALHQHPLIPFTLTKAIILGHLGIYSIYWIFCFLRFFVQLKDTLKIRRFYYETLQVTDNELQTLPWELILEKVVWAQSSRRLSVVKDLSIHDVVLRLMRKENYLIGMLNKGVLAFPVPSWIPGAGPTVKFGPKSNGVQYRLLLTSILEWTLSWFLLQSMFDRNACIQREFISDPKTLKKRLRILGFVMLLFSPFLVVLMLVSLFLKHAEQLYNHPSRASSRRWSNLTKWLFREFNEVDHFFKHRINNNSSLVHASEYLKQFPSPKLSIVAKFVSFISGGFAAVLIIIAFLEESLLEGHIFGRNLFWYAAVFSTMTAVSRAAVHEELVLDPEGKMSLVVQHSHYMPKRWRRKEYSEAVKMEFGSLFPYTGMLLLEEISSIFVTPVLLLFVVPNRVDDILQFIANFTVDLEGVGHVCSFRVIDFESHGNSRYGSPFDSTAIQRSCQGKMEKSFLSFRSSYPSWEPNSQGKALLTNIENFMEQKYRTLAIRTPAAYITSKMNYIGTTYHCRLSLMEFDHPYVLDWYYSSQPQHFNNDSREVPPTNPFGEPTEDLLQPSPLTRKVKPTTWRQDEAQYGDEFWDRLFDGRTDCQPAASTSGSLFQGNVVQNQDFNIARNLTTSHWWDRKRPQDANPQTSFLEPKSFNYYHCDPSSDPSSVGKQQYLDWRYPNGLSTTYSDSDARYGGQLNLPFGDIYT